MPIPTICVIVAARNASKTVYKCLDSITKNDFPGHDFEIVFIDDHSDDNTGLIVRQHFPQVKFFANPRQGPSAARNYGAQLTSAPYIAFTDSDCLAAVDWLFQLYRGITSGPFSSVGGIQGAPADECRFGKKIFLFMQKVGFLTEYIKYASDPARSIIAVSHNPSCNVIYDRGVFLKEGGFLEDFFPGEDVEFDHLLTRKGYRLGFNAGAIVYHYRGCSWTSFFRRMFSYGQTQGQLVRTYGFFRKIQYIPLITIGLCIALVWLCVANLLAAITTVFAAAIILFLWLHRDYMLTGMFLTGFFLWHSGFFSGYRRLLRKR